MPQVNAHSQMLSSACQRKNLILSQVVEERMVDSALYSGSTGGKMITTKRVLAQAMVPGIYLVKVELAQSVYDECVRPVFQTSSLL